MGGALLLVRRSRALVWANSPWGAAYETLRDTRVGPAALHLDLSLGTWAADGLLAIFFFVAGLELKREFVAGDLREPRRAALPVAAAVGGMAVPALFFVLFNLGGEEGALRGWAIPSATDIAFALAVLAVLSTHLPSALRTFLLTLAVVDDLLAIVVIAIFYTEELNVPALLLSLIPLALFGLLVQKRIRSWWLLLPLAAVTWVLMHESGVHATVAGVLLAFTVPVARSEAAGGPDAGPGLAEHFEHRIRPLSAGVAVPGVRVLLGGCGGWRASPGSAPRSGTASRSASWSAWSPARRSASPPRPGSSPGSRGRSSTRTWAGRTSSGCPFSAASDSPSRCSSRSSPTVPRARATTTRRWASSLARSPPRHWRPSSSGCATVATGRSTRRSSVDADADGIPDAWDPVDDRRGQPFADS